MRRRQRKPINWFLVTILLVLIAFFVYLDRYVIPSIPPPFVPTSTATRDPESYISEANGLFAKGKLLQAIDIYKEAIRIEPNDPAIYIALARAQIFAGKTDEAIINAANALLLNPNNSMAHAVRGWALTKQGDYLMAENVFKRALELDPNNGMVHAYYAELLGLEFQNNTGPFDAIDLAIEQSRVAVTLAPNTIEAHWIRGFILDITGNREDAIQEYLAAININPNIPDLHLDLGLSYFALGVSEKAVAEFTIASTLNPLDPYPDLYTSRVYLAEGQYAKAAQYAEQAVFDAPSDAYLRGNFGLTLYHNLQWPEAIIQLSLAVNGGTDSNSNVVQPLTLTSGRIGEYFYTYALALARTGRCAEALPIAQLVLGNIPTDEIAYYNAQQVIGICERSLLTPSPIPTTTPETTLTPSP